MHKCMHRWVDPLAGRIETSIGPYSCGRPYGHRGVHATDGNGASALWRGEDLLLSIESLPRTPGDPDRLVETYPELEGAGDVGDERGGALRG